MSSPSNLLCVRLKILKIMAIDISHFEGCQSTFNIAHNSMLHVIHERINCSWFYPRYHLSENALINAIHSLLHTFKSFFKSRQCQNWETFIDCGKSNPDIFHFWCIIYISTRLNKIFQQGFEITNCSYRSGDDWFTVPENLLQVSSHIWNWRLSH